ncbi:MAG: hypothetical protein ABEI06_09570, partial [Halobacteriaceae archaeon]
IIVTFLALIVDTLASEASSGTKSRVSYIHQPRRSPTVPPDGGTEKNDLTFPLDESESEDTNNSENGR